MLVKSWTSLHESGSGSSIVDPCFLVLHVDIRFSRFLLTTLVFVAVVLFVGRLGFWFLGVLDTRLGTVVDSVCIYLCVTLYRFLGTHHQGQARR